MTTFALFAALSALFIAAVALAALSLRSWGEAHGRRGALRLVDPPERYGAVVAAERFLAELERQQDLSNERNPTAKM